VSETKEISYTAEYHIYMYLASFNPLNANNEEYLDLYWTITRVPSYARSFRAVWHRHHFHPFDNGGSTKRWRAA